MLGGFYQPDAGAIRLGEREIAGKAAYAIARAGVARTYQASQLFGSMCGARQSRDCALQGWLGIKQDDSYAAAEQLAAFVGYRGDLMRRAADLPHVDRRLIEIARASGDRTERAAAR